MNDFELVKRDVKIDTAQLPLTTPIQCEDCDWKGTISTCDTEMSNEGWEYPEYEVLVCPKCGVDLLL